jgi:DNA-binding transcriptional LysR family regulator
MAAVTYIQGELMSNFRAVELRQLRQFTAVAEHLSFRRAAEHLHMAQPPLSIAIAKLEAELGVQLFERNGRSTTLTAAGTAILPLAKRCSAIACEIPAVARGAQNGESGVLRLGFVGSATYALLPKLMPAFRRRYPAVEVELQESINMNILALLESGNIDVGLVRVPTYQPQALRFDVVEHDVFKAVLPASHPLARKRSVTLARLAQEPLISHAPSRVPGLSQLTMAAFQQAGASPRIAQQAYQVQTIISLVESGLGVALVPAVSQRHASDRVVFRPVSDLPETIRLGIAIATPLEAKPVSERLREVALEVCSPRRQA